MMQYDVLMKSPIFAGIAGKDLEKLVACIGGRTLVFDKGSIIQAADEWVEEIGIVLSGSVDTVMEDFWGAQVLLGRFFVGETFGDSYVLAHDEPLPFSVIAAADRTQIYLFNYRRAITVCRDACDTHVQLIENLLSISAKKNLRLLRKISHLTNRNIHEKVLAMLSSFAREYGSNTFTLPYTRQELANYLAVDRSALSTELGRLHREGLLTVEKNTFTLHHDPAR